MWTVLTLFIACNSFEANGRCIPSHDTSQTVFHDAASANRIFDTNRTGNHTAGQVELHDGKIVRIFVNKAMNVVEWDFRDIK
jgi:Cu/Zn superoxide dismutase